MNQAGSGTSTAALCIAGYTSTVVDNVESWNGSAWTETTDINTARRQTMGFGTQTSALIFGGLTPPATARNICESWNGTSWTEVTDLSQVRRQGQGAGATNTSGLAAAGYSGTANVAVTEEWTAPVKTTVTFTAS